MADISKLSLYSIYKSGLAVSKLNLYAIYGTTERLESLILL